MTLHLIRSELLKLTSTRMTRWMAASTLAIVALNVALNIANAGRGEALPLTTTEGVDQVFAAAGTGMTLMLVLGVMAMSGELRHGTATATILATPRRHHVVLAKAAAAALAGISFSLLAVAITLAIGLPWLSAETTTVPSLGGTASILAGSVFLTVLAAILGVGIGSILRNQTAAVALSLSWVLLLEGLLGQLLPSVGRWTIGGTTASLVSSVGTGFTEGDLLPWWAAAALLLGYTSLALTGGIRSLRRVDL